MEIKVVKNILEANEEIASQNKSLFSERGIYVLNLMGSPGAGKTTLLERTIANLKNRIKIAVIEGDVETSRDAERIAVHGVPALQINTGGACHLDGNMLRKAIEEFDLDETRFLIVENVGNLICPAGFKLGEDDKAMIISVTEGDDKPAKYPLMFQVSSVLLLNKIDLLPYLDFNVERFRDDALKINPKLRIFRMSCKTGEGLADWTNWIEDRLNEG
jgi:hydrogenase nickel incorporation protein HypB